jgi:hypothetical protein
MTAIAAGQVRNPRATVAPIPLTRVTAVELRKMFDTRSGFWLIASIAITSLLAAIGVVLWPRTRRPHLCEESAVRVLVADPRVAAADPIVTAGTLDARVSGNQRRHRWLSLSGPRGRFLPRVILDAAVHPPRPLQARRWGRTVSSSPGGCRCPCPRWRRLCHRRPVSGMAADSSTAQQREDWRRPAHQSQSSARSQR